MSTQKPLQNGSHPVHDSGALMHRSVFEEPYKVVSGHGCYLKLDNGQEILDGCGGAVVVNIGHGNAEVRAAMLEQIDKISYIQTNSYTTSAAEELADIILEIPPGGFDHGLEKAYFCGSGSEANDAIMKLCRQYFFEKGEKQRKWYVARRQAYHGNTVGAMSLSSNLPRKIPYEPLQLPNVAYVSPAYAYQYRLPSETEEEYAERLVAELDAKFQELGSENVISFVAEPIVGATSGARPAPKGYFRGVRKVCDKYGILLHLDEVMAGMGRTGTLFAFEQEGITPDVVTIAKGLGGGYAPIGGMLISKKIMDAFRQGSGAYNHFHTYQNHAVMCAAALAVQKIVKRDNLIHRCKAMGNLLHKLLIEALQDRKYVGDIRGRGLLWGIEFVRNKETRASFSPDLNFAVRFQTTAHELGLDVYPCRGIVDGTRGDLVLIGPPFTISEEDLRKLVRLLRQAYDIEEARIES